MMHNFHRLLGLLVLVLAVGCCGGCGKNWEARKIIKQAEASRSIYDFNLLIEVLQGADELSESTQEACRTLAENILREKVIASIKDQDSEACKLLLEKLNGESVQKLINAARINQTLQIFWLKELQSMLGSGTGAKMMPEIAPARFEEWSFILDQIIETEIRTAGRRLLAVSRVIWKKELPETLPDLYEMCHKNILRRCSECRGAGRMRCYSCHKGAFCKLCNPSELSSSSSHARRSNCRHCSGDGHMAESCRACRGRKYHVNKRALLHYYKGQVMLLQQQLQEALELLQDLPDVKSVVAENAQDSR